MKTPTFKIQLTKEQAKEIQRQWEAHGELCGAMLAAQPHLNWGPFGLENPYLSFGILSPQRASRVADALAS